MYFISLINRDILEKNIRINVLNKLIEKNKNDLSILNEEIDKLQHKLPKIQNLVEETKVLEDAVQQELKFLEKKLNEKLKKKARLKKLLVIGSAIAKVIPYGQSVLATLVQTISNFDESNPWNSIC